MVSWRSNIKVKAKVKIRYKMPIFCPISTNKVKVYHFSVGYLDISGIFFQTVLGVLVKHLYFALVLHTMVKFDISFSVICTFLRYLFQLYKDFWLNTYFLPYFCTFSTNFHHHWWWWHHSRPSH